MECQRGFTLVELLVVAGILALLTAGVVTMSLAQRPGALRAAAGGFDAMLATARAVAASSGNGATLVFASRSDGRGARIPGFTLTLYRGRPTAANAITSEGAIPLVSSVNVREANLGAPPFTIFLSSAGHASGLSSYPAFDSGGKPQFAVLTRQPACPSGHLALTFESAHATQSRTLPCGVSVVGPAQPMPTMSPAPVQLTPRTLTFFWPGAPQQHFVATEWGYTRWFAAGSFACGGNVAQFPQSAPAPPYTQPNAPDDASAQPQAPAGVPYSFANAPDSMEDAPAWFYLSPQGAGLCSAAIADAYAQRATLPVEVMGWLTLQSSGTVATAQTPPLALSTRLQHVGDTVSIAASKSYDGDGSGLRPVAAIASPCTPYVSATAPASTAGGSTSATEATPVTLTVTQTSSTTLSCSGNVSDQYGEPPVQFTFTLTANTSPLTVRPAAVEYPMPGGTLTSFVSPSTRDPGALLNRLLLGAVAQAAFAPCAKGQARAFTDTGFTSPDTSFGPNGCYDGHLAVSEPGYNGEFSYSNSASGSCTGIVSPSGWNPATGVGPSATLSVLPQAVGTCTIVVDDNAGQVAGHYSDAAAKVVSICGYPTCALLREEQTRTHSHPCRMIECPTVNWTQACWNNGYGSNDGGTSWTLTSSVKTGAAGGTYDSTGGTVPMADCSNPGYYPGYQYEQDQGFWMSPPGQPRTIPPPGPSYPPLLPP